jgi:cation diffusion facilitator CzcD-associated flavoprotein CzcO
LTQPDAKEYDRDGMADVRVVIIGSGFGGLGMAIRLKQAGFGAITILEKAARVGGTWRENTYPGAACDSPSFLYCYSFEPKADWSRKWAPQPEILGYLEDCARKHDLLRHIRFNTEVTGARFDEAAGVWRIRTAAGDTVEAEVLVSATGQLNRPSVPALPGIERFAGRHFHSACWEHDVPLDGRNVAVIGNAASAVQFVPEIAPRVRRLAVFQRSANWMVPKNDRLYGEREKRLYARFPFLARLYRWWIYLQYEKRFPVFRQNRLLTRLATLASRRALGQQVPDPELQRLLLPDYPLGGKRILISDDYYAALQRENVALVTSPIEQVTPDGIRTRDGRHVPADVIIFATGFQTTGFLAPMRIEGADGRVLDDVWQQGADAYLGLAVAGFPNFFMLYGPNTNLGHNSIVFMLECQVNYVVRCVQALAARGLRYLDVRAEVVRAYNAELQHTLRRTVWARTDHSWYKRADGRITNNWSGTTLAYWWRTRRPDFGHYRQVPRVAAVEPAVSKVA